MTYKFTQDLVKKLTVNLKSYAFFSVVLFVRSTDCSSSAGVEEWCISLGGLAQVTGVMSVSHPPLTKSERVLSMFVCVCPSIVVRTNFSCRSSLGGDQRTVCALKLSFSTNVRIRFRLRLGSVFKLEIYLWWLTMRLRNVVSVSVFTNPTYVFIAPLVHGDKWNEELTTSQRWWFRSKWFLREHLGS